MVFWLAFYDGILSKMIDNIKSNVLNCLTCVALVVGGGGDGDVGA